MKTDIIQADDLSAKADNFDVIQSFWKSGGNVDLTDKQKELSNRWHTAFVLMENGALDSEVAKTMVLTYDISKMQAYRDIKNAKSMFADVVGIDIKIERYFALQSCKELIKAARIKKDLKAWSAAIKNLIQIAGITNENIDADLYKKLEKHEVVINLTAHDIKILEYLTQSGSFDFSQLASEAELIPWEEVEKSE